MERLTDEELAVLPEGPRNWVRQMENEIERDYPTVIDRSWHRLATELAKALTPQPCGHPRGCVVSAPSGEGHPGVEYCGWCAAEVERDQFATALKACNEVSHREIAKLAQERDNNLADSDYYKAKRDALRERLAAANNHVDLLKRILIDLDNEDSSAFDLLCERHDVPNELLMDCGLIYAEELADDDRT